MTALVRVVLSELQRPPGLKRLARRSGDRPALALQWPCLQRDQTSEETCFRALEAGILRLPGVTACEPPHAAPGMGFALCSEMALGQPEAFLGGTCWLNLRPDGSMHLGLRPEWAQRVLDRSWATVHPFARYMAGAVPPQSVVVYAPRNTTELGVALRIARAARFYAMGRVGDLILPDTRW